MRAPKTPDEERLDRLAQVAEVKRQWARPITVLSGSPATVTFGGGGPKTQFVHCPKCDQPTAIRSRGALYCFKCREWNPGEQGAR